MFNFEKGDVLNHQWPQSKCRKILFWTFIFCGNFKNSTTSESSVVEKCKDLGADDFIIKPAKTIILKNKLIEIFNLELE